MNNSTTPRCDKLCAEHSAQYEYANGDYEQDWKDLAHELERENVALGASAKSVDDALTTMFEVNDSLRSDIERVERENAALREHIKQIRHAWAAGTEDELAEVILNAASFAIATGQKGQA